jgi:hypothetical protein
LPRQKRAKAHKSRGNKAASAPPFYYINSIFPISALKSTPFVYKSAFWKEADLLPFITAHKLAPAAKEIWCAGRGNKIAALQRYLSLSIHRDIFPQSDRFLLHYTPNINVLPDFLIHPRSACINSACAVPAPRLIMYPF